MANISQNWLDKGLLDILIIFTYNYKKKRYSTQIAKELNMPNRTVTRKLDIASKQNLIKYIREGKNKLYYLDLKQEKTFQILIMLESYKAIKYATKNPKISLMIEKYEPKIIFGSNAKFEKGKDLDIVFFKEQKLDDEYIHAQYTTKNEFKKQLIKKETLHLEIANKHIILSDYDYFVKLFIEHYND